jgi:hypothetical protein
MEGSIEEITACITRKWTARGVGAMQAGRQSNDQEPGPGISKGRHRRAEISRMALPNLV